MTPTTPGTTGGPAGDGAGGRPATAEELDLARHPEGGWYRETWRSDITVRPEGYPGERAVSTAIHFLLEPGDESRWHRLRSAELWLWHRGGPLHLVLGGDGERPGEETTLVLGPDTASGQCLQGLVPAGHWQCARPAGAQEALVSCVVTPGFSFDDFQLLPQE
ncbi:cupin domain-containing protein [Streptomyces sulfonofaciens]|nr:cupin domain-containing protein [Streptomyces sulfonofaciens]